MKKWLVSLVLCLSLVYGTACHKKTVVTNMPVGVTSTEVTNWYTAVGITSQIANTTNDLTEVLIQLNKAGVWRDGPSYASALRSCGRIAQAGQVATNQLRQMPNDFGKSQHNILLTLGNSMLTELSNVNTLAMVDIKNPNSQAAVQLLIKSIQAALVQAQTFSQ